MNTLQRYFRGLIRVSDALDTQGYHAEAGRILEAFNGIALAIIDLPEFSLETATYIEIMLGAPDEDAGTPPTVDSMLRDMRGVIELCADVLAENPQTIQIACGVIDMVTEMTQAVDGTPFGINPSQFGYALGLFKSPNGGDFI